MLTLYAATIVLGASLLFLVQPMFARMALPLLGGAPAVWNTALVFYQAVLLGGYAYAHVATSRLGLRRQAALHLVLLLLPLIVLPIRIPPGWAPPVEANPAPWLLGVMAVSVGLPFFAVSTTTPVLGTWFARAGHRAVADPYVLYAASNLGSLVALVAYPTLVEPSLALAAQSRFWALGYAALVVLTGGCAAWSLRSPDRGAPAEPAGDGRERLTARRRLRWVLLAAVPSSLTLSVTTYLGTDVATVPLLWVIPLALYLSTLVLAFARRGLVPQRIVRAALPVVLLPLVMALAGRANEPIALLVPLHLAAFWVAALACHGEIARDRPAPAHLAAFYLWLAVGGALGGAFTALLAPLIFTSVAEYPLALVAACLLAARPDPSGEPWRRRLLDLALPAALGALTAGLVAGGQAGGPWADLVGPGVMFGLPALVCLTFARRPVRFGLGVAAILVAGGLYRGEEGRVLHAERSFFGIHRVTLDPSGRYHLLLHGTTLHGMQSLEPARRREPLAYFHREGPVGQLVAAWRGSAAPRTVAVVGLGAGAIACHGVPDERWTFYEIDPVVEWIARDPGYFTFLRECPPAVDVVLGDARRSLAAAPSGRYGLIALDAYSGDAPPVHLLTREALALYLEKLAAAGLLAFNISNRHLDLEPVLADLALDARLAALVRHDAVVSAEDRARGRTPARWVVMARAAADLGALGADPRWRPAQRRAGAAMWTDDFSSLLPVLRWRPDSPR